jgi:DNA-binding MarR family transcriptional regulator
VSPDGYDPPERLRLLPSWLAGQAARRAQRLVEHELGQVGARRAHFSVLASLAEQGVASQADLGRRLWIDRSDLHALINELEHAGHVSRVPDECDRRRNVIALTRQGRTRLAQLDRSLARAQDAFLAPLDDGERKRLARLLERLID